MKKTIISDAVGCGIQLFRVRSPLRHFIEVAELPALPDEWIARRRVWRAKGEESLYALLTIPYKDEEDILVRAPHARWHEWDWKELAATADQCRWKGPDNDTKFVF